MGSLLTLTYGYSSTNNNGNVASQTIASPLTTGGTLTAQQVYTYDGVNRLLSTQETVQSGLPSGTTAGNWTLNDGNDQYGNHWATTALPMGPAMPTLQTQFNAAVNRLSERSTGVALPSDAYDLAGNLQDHPDIGQMTYDAENRLLTFTSGGTMAAYDYDGEGRRVRKVVTGTNAGTTVDVNDAAGQLTAEIVPAGSDPDTGTRYLTADHLGSTRAVTDGSGNLVDRMDYFPFGQTVPSGQSFGNRNLLMGYGAASGVTLEFTGKETDGESGLDYFGARYFSGLQGRFTSPDPTPAGISMGDPQSWNLYSYVRNRPTGSVDSNGLWATPLHPEIIQIALGGILSAGEIQQLAARQYAMDGDQSPGGSYKHFMRSPGQTADEATEESWSFVSTRLLQATTMLGPNGELTSASLSSLGDAMHTLQDFTSPSHTDSSGMPFVWRGFVREGINLVGHWWGENSPDVNWSRFGMAVKLTMGAYIQADPEGAAKLGLTSENLDAEFATRMGNYVSSFYSFSQGYSGKPSELGVNSARLCALGNPAACARGIWDK